MRRLLVLLMVGCAGCGDDGEYLPITDDDAVRIWIEGQLDKAPIGNQVYNASLNACFVSVQDINRCGRRQTDDKLPDLVKIHESTEDEDDQNKAVACNDTPGTSVEHGIVESICRVNLLDALPEEEFWIQINERPYSRITMPKDQPFQLNLPASKAIITRSQGIGIPMTWLKSEQNTTVRWWIEVPANESQDCVDADWSEAHGETEDDGNEDIPLEKIPELSTVCNVLLRVSRHKAGEPRSGIRLDIGGRYSDLRDITIQP